MPQTVTVTCYIPKNSYNKITNRDNSPQDHYKAVTPCFDFFIFLWWDCLKKTEQKICSVQKLYLYIWWHGRGALRKMKELFPLFNVMYCYTYRVGYELMLLSCQRSVPRYSAPPLTGRPPVSAGPLWFDHCPDVLEHLMWVKTHGYYRAGLWRITYSHVTGEEAETHLPERSLPCPSWYGMWWWELEQRRYRCRWGLPTLSPAVKTWQKEKHTPMNILYWLKTYCGSLWYTVIPYLWLNTMTET